MFLSAIRKNKLGMIEIFDPMERVRGKIHKKQIDTN